MKLVELIIGELTDALGFSGNSLVEDPAIEENFFAFKEVDVENLIVENIIREEMSKYLNEEVEDISQFIFASEDQQILAGPLMIPNRPILRIDEEGEPYHVFFSEQTVRDISEKMLKDKLIDVLNTDHDPNRPVQGHLMSSWIIEDPEMDQSRLYGFENLPKGTWFCLYRILDKDVWARVKRGGLRGFSIEAFLASRTITK